MRSQLALVSAATLMSLACGGRQATTAPAEAPEPLASEPAPAPTEPPAAAAAEPTPAAEPALGVEVEHLAGPVWLHRSFHDTKDWGRVEANGIIVFGDSGAVLVDTAWSPKQARWLLDWIEGASGRQAVAAIVTHFHGDRAAGIAAARERGIRVYGYRGTAELLRDRGQPEPSHLFTDTLELDLGDVAVEAFYPGPGHAPDNAVVFVAGAELLYGGCLIRAAATDNLGNLGDADVAAWPGTMERVISRYGEAARLVIPGHGAVGDATLLEHTLELARGAR